MAGHNHYPTCNCGWCRKISYSRTINGGVFRIPEEYNIYQFIKFIDGKRISFVRIQNGETIKELDLLSKTKSTICGFCGQEIFYYENKYGSKVFFNYLGKPWEKHECGKYLEDNRNKILDNEKK